MAYKVDYIQNFSQMDKYEKLAKLKELVENSFYETVESKTMWNKVLNEYIKPPIKRLHPRYNSDVVLEIVN